MSEQWAQAIMTIGIPTVMILVGILVSTSRISDLNSGLADLREDMGRGFDGMNYRFNGTNRRIDDLRAEMLRMEGVIDARLRHLEEERR